MIEILVFCKQWFGQFPEFLPNPFYISGESYAGIYVPTLASQVVKGINSALFFIISSHNTYLIMSSINFKNLIINSSFRN